MEYLENQCADDPQDRVTCDYQEYENQDLGFPDLLIQGVTKEEVWIIEVTLQRQKEHYLPV